MYASKLTPDIVETYLFHDWERGTSVARACIGLRWSKYSTHWLVCNRALRLCALFEGLVEFCFVFRFGFYATLLDCTSRIEWLHFCYYCADVWRVLAHFRVANTVAHADRRQFHDAPCIPGRSAVSAQPWLLQRLLGRFVARCALVRNSL